MALFGKSNKKHKIPRGYNWGHFGGKKVRGDAKKAKAQRKGSRKKIA